MLLITLGLAAVAILAVGYGAYRWLWSPVFKAGFRPGGPAPTRRSSHRFDPESSATVRGGASVARSHASGPLATITVDSSWMHIGGGVPEVWIPRDDVTGVEMVRGRLGPAGLIFRTADGEFDSVLVMAPDCVAALRRFGWPVAPNA